MSKGRTLSLVAVLLIAGCNGDSSPSPASAPATKAKTAASFKRGPTPEELTAGMVEAVPIGKSTVPINVKFELPERPMVGRALDIVIAIMPQVAGSASLQVTGTDGLQIAAAVGTIGIPAVEPTQAYRVTISTTPTLEGVQLLTLNVSLTHDDATEARTFSVPVIVSGSGDAAVSKR